MSTSVHINRLSNGVPGFNEVLGGGLPEFSFNLIAGLSGSGKTTLSHQMMFALATPERPALYFTVLGEPPLKMLRYQQQFEFFQNQAINHSVRYINLSMDTLAGDLDAVLRRIVSEVEIHSSGLVFVDSFRSVVLASQPQSNPNNNLPQFVQQWGVMMTSWQATTFLIGEYFFQTESNPIFTVVDGLIWMGQSVQRNSMVRQMQIMKMRGQSTLPGLHTFRINQTGVTEFAPVQHSVKPLAAQSATRSRRASDLSIDEIVHLLLHEVKRLGATRVVIDSLSGFELALAPTFREDFRESLSCLVSALNHVGVSDPSFLHQGTDRCRHTANDGEITSVRVRSGHL